MKRFLGVYGLALLLGCYLPVQADAATEEERAQAFACGATGKCQLPYNHPLVQQTRNDIAEVERACESTNKSLNSVPDRFGFARAYLDQYQNLGVLFKDFRPITEKHCASFSLDEMLNAYVLERNSKATHSATIASLLANPKVLLKKWKGKKARGNN